MGSGEFWWVLDGSGGFWWDLVGSFLIVFDRFDITPAGENLGRLIFNSCRRWKPRTFDF